MNETYLTLRLPFNAYSDEARLLLTTARLFRYTALRLHNLILEENPRITSLIALKRMYRKRLQEILPNRRYVDGVITLVYSIYESAQVLGVPFSDIEFKSWLLFQQSEKEYPCRNVTLQRDYSFRITTINYQGESKRILLKPTISRSYRRVLDKIIEEKQSYVARIVLRGFGERKRVLWIHGEVHLSIPYKFYLEHFRRHKRNYGKLFGGVDVNVDRINLAIVNKYGRLRDVKTFWFEEASWKGCSRQRAWSIIGMGSPLYMFLYVLSSVHPFPPLSVGFHPSLGRRSPPTHGDGTSAQNNALNKNINITHHGEHIKTYTII